MMNVPHWRCWRCDGSRYKVNKGNPVTCYKCGALDKGEGM